MLVADWRLNGVGQVAGQCRWRILHQLLAAWPMIRAAQKNGYLSAQFE